MLAMEDGGGLGRRAEQAWGALQLVPVGCGRLWVRAAGSRWCDPLRRGGFLGRRPDRAGRRTSNPAADCEEECQQSHGGDHLPVPVAASTASSFWAAFQEACWI